MLVTCIYVSFDCNQPVAVVHSEGHVESYGEVGRFSPPPAPPPSRSGDESDDRRDAASVAQPEDEQDENPSDAPVSSPGASTTNICGAEAGMDGKTAAQPESTQNGVADPPSAGASRTNIEKRTSRSLRTSLLITGIRPFGSRLIAPKTACPATAPELHAPESVFDTCNVRQRSVRDLDVRLYEINSRASLSTRENFVPAKIHSLKTEQRSHPEASVHADSEALRQVQTHEQENVISRDFGGPVNGHGEEKRRKHIYYFAGGGWQTPPAKEHWKLCAHLAHTLTSQGHPTTVTLVSHPLAPKMKAQDTLPILERLYYEIMPSTPPPSLREKRSSHDLLSDDITPVSAHAAPAPDGSADPPSTDSNGLLSHAKTKTRYLPNNNEDVIFAGDSSGGNVALSLVLNVLADNPSARVPASIFLVSPAVDLRNANPDIATAERADPLMSKKYIDWTASQWAGSDAERARPEHSPLLRDLGVLAKRAVRVDGIVGTADVLAPDALRLAHKCREQGVAGAWLQWEGQMHCFPLAFAYKVLPESNQAVQWMVERLKAEL